MAATAALTILAGCFVSSGIVVATAVECSGSAAGFPSGKQTCTSSGPDYGKMCMKTEINGLLIQGCDGSPNVPSLCSLAGNPTTCCKMPASGQKIICNASDFSTLVSAADFQNCSANCTAASDCLDDTAALTMFGQMPEPKCLFLIGQMSFGCDWTLSQIQQDCPACPYSYTGRDMNTKLGDLCKKTCGLCGGTSSGASTTTGTPTSTTFAASTTSGTATRTASNSTTTNTAGATTGFMSGSIVSVPSLIGMVLTAMVVMLGC